MGSDTPRLLTADERLALISVKIERAKNPIPHFNALLPPSTPSKPYILIKKIDPSSGQVHYYLSRMEPIPSVISAATGDALQNLRSALDHLTNHLLLVRLGTPTTDEQLNFPISNGAKEHKAVLDGKVQRLRRDAIEALRSVDAYKGGKGHKFWVLN